jgi:polysaccharide export outer membrane protein
MILARKMVKGIVAVGLVLMALLFAGCEALNNSASQQQGVAENPVVSSGNNGNENRIASGDKLLIEFSDVTPPPPAVTTTVHSDGTVSLPFNVTVQAEGKTWSQLANEIHAKYVPQYYRQLTVTVRGEDRYYTVLGEVRNPGPKSYIGQVTVLRAIAAAGDFTDFAKKTNIQVTRSNGKKLKINAKKALKDPSLDLPVYPGDTVFISRRVF